MNIDLKLLKAQKAILNKLIDMGKFPNENNDSTVEFLIGIVNMLDVIQDKLEDEKPLEFRIDMPEKPKVLITIEGGNIQNVSANCDLQYVIVEYDHDGINDEPVTISEKMEPDGIIKPGEKFHIELLQGELTAVEKKAKRELKKLDF